MKYLFITVLSLSYIAHADNIYWSCAGEGEFKDVTISGYSDNFSFAGPYTCIGEKKADYISGTKAEKSVIAKLISNNEQDFFYQKLNTNYYMYQSKFLKESVYKTNFKVAIVDWSIYHVDEKLKANEGEAVALKAMNNKLNSVDYKLSTFTCRALPTGYSAPCSIKDEATKKIVQGEAKPLSKVELLKMVNDYFESLANGNATDKEEFLSVIDKITKK